MFLPAFCQDNGSPGSGAAAIGDTDDSDSNLSDVDSDPDVDSRVDSDPDVDCHVDSDAGAIGGLPPGGSRLNESEELDTNPNGAAQLS